MQHTKPVRTLTLITLELVILQVLRFAIKESAFLFVQKSDFSDRMASMFAFAILSAALVCATRQRKEPLSLFPARFGTPYFVGTVLFAVFLIATPIITGDSGRQSLLLLAYSGIATPIFEELVFRGYVWNKLQAVFKKGWQVYMATSILFGLWHLGYIDSIAYRVTNGLASAMLMKVLVGLGYGFILGALRLKTKNCYSTMLLHGAMNVFGR